MQNNKWRVPSRLEELQIQNLIFRKIKRVHSIKDNGIVCLANVEYLTGSPLLGRIKL